MNRRPMQVRFDHSNIAGLVLRTAGEDDPRRPFELGGKFVEKTDHARSFDREVAFPAGALPVMVIYQVQNEEPPAIGDLVAHEVERPAPCSRGDGARKRGPSNEDRTPRHRPASQSRPYCRRRISSSWKCPACNAGGIHDVIIGRGSPAGSVGLPCRRSVLRPGSPARQPWSGGSPDQGRVVGRQPNRKSTTSWPYIFPSSMPR